MHAERNTDRQDPRDPRILRGTASVEIARVEQLSDAELTEIFSLQELQDAGGGSGRAASLAARLAAKEACCELFPREVAAGGLRPADFTVERDGYGAPHLVCGPDLCVLLDGYRLRGIALSLTHNGGSAAAVAVAEPEEIRVPIIGKIMYYLLPFRRRVMLANLRRVFGGRVPQWEIVRLAQAHYAHYVRVVFEFFQFNWLSAERRARVVRIENEEAILSAAAQGKGVLVVTAHFGNWEVASVAAAMNHPQYRDRFHMVRRYLWPRWFFRMLNNRVQRAGIGVIEKKGSLDALLARLAAGEVVVMVLDQHAGGRDGVRVDFLGEPAWVFRSPAIIARTTGAPVVPAACWRDSDGCHVIRFEAALPIVTCDDPEEGIRANTRSYVAALEPFILRHPEQWGMWMHQMWKEGPNEVPKRLRQRIAERVARVLQSG